MQTGIDNIWLDYGGLWGLFSTFAGIVAVLFWDYMHKRAVGKMTQQSYSSMTAVLTVAVMVPLLMMPLVILVVTGHDSLPALVEYLTTGGLFYSVGSVFEVMAYAIGGWRYTRTHPADETPVPYPYSLSGAQ